MTDAAPIPPVTLLGPQRRPTLTGVVRRLGLHGARLATVTAGWQDREGEDEELDQHLGGQATNLVLWHRCQEILDGDPELAAADRRRRESRAEIQDLYLIGVAHAMAALNEMFHQPDRGRALVQQAIADADSVLHDLDTRHLERVAEIEAAFYEHVRPHERESIARHRAQVLEIVAGCAGVAVAGGHVSVLLDVLHMLNLAPLLARRPTIAWSAGAMVLTDRVVLFNDRTTHGHAFPEVYARGLGLVHDVVALPAARQRLLMDDHPRMASMARRFAPSWCVPLDPGAKVTFDADYALPESTAVIGHQGAVLPLAEAGGGADD